MPLEQASQALLTDLYQLTMAYGYWKLGRAEEEAVFHLFFRTLPFRGGYSIAAGLAHACEYLSNLRFGSDDLEYLASLQGHDQRPLFDPAFLGYLEKMSFACDVDAIPEGTVAFAHEPLLRIRGPLWQCQLVETPLLNAINFSTLIATKAARICLAAQGDLVLEFGLRRAQGSDGALSASRAAYIGGCAATSNCLAGKRYNIPVRGTHAHSWVMSFADEQEAFAAYARAMPNNCVFLVDTYNTLEGVQKAIKIGHWLQQAGHSLIGIRLDSGDLYQLSIAARDLLDRHGFANASIVASNDLDEYQIAALKTQGAKINVWGVGTRLVTAYDQPALGGVYKLSAIRSPGSTGWDYKIKLSEEAIKISTPGTQQVRRYTLDGVFIGDLIYDEEMGPSTAGHLFESPQHELSFPQTATFEDLLTPIFRRGQLVYKAPSLLRIRERTLDQLAHLRADSKHLTPTKVYPVGLEQQLASLKASLMQKSRTLSFSKSG